jgi:DNA-binding Lrp family transcriptional regulator
MALTLDALNLRLLGDWQRNFPLISNPFAEIGMALGCPEAEVLQRLTQLSAAGAVSRVGATIRPNTAGASTLAAVAAPILLVDEVAELIGAEPGVNHSYLRENDWNIWFVATGPDRAHVDAILNRIEMTTGLPVLDLRLVRPYPRLFARRHPAGTRGHQGRRPRRPSPWRPRRASGADPGSGYPNPALRRSR